MPYIWQREDWPKFTWDTQLLERSVYAYGMEAGRLAGQIRYLPEGEKMDALIDLMVSEAVKTSQIEGENYDREDVRSSIRNQLGLNATPQAVRDPRANGVAALMISVRDQIPEDLTAERLWEWQDMIIVGHYDRARLEVGRWRGNPEPMQIVSGAIGKEKVHYEAPPAACVPQEMAHFITWFNDSRNMPGVVRAGVAHLWFECIHPFSDGNGRVGRVIAEKALSQELGAPATLSLSTAIERRRNDYYDALSRASRGGMDITEWLAWFTELVLEAQAQARERIGFTLAKTRFWDRHAKRLNERQAKAIARMLREGPEGFKGGMSAQKYMKIADCSKATATRDLSELSRMDVLRKLEGGGRSTRYDIVLPEG